ncbi:energy transducer TonB [Pelovirga terrestris]|uniref:TonB family protein n=1 Tax=Pelovirga terrestris TaxID=2771352 RepID=A0A8J6UKJ4_9BACT|nr:energy transducer TonB [Pelovirga terrestris]MBD1399512.1 TonB family protein [Pelovirga terrestris]
MDNLSSQKSTRIVSRTHLFLACLLLSLLLHVVAILLLQTAEPVATTSQPTVIQLVDMPPPEPEPEPEPQPSYEIDQPPRPPEPEQEVESPRRAERDQRVEREQAPPGDDVRDQRQGIMPTPAQPPKPAPLPPSVPEPPAAAAPAAAPTPPPTTPADPEQPQPRTEEGPQEAQRLTEDPAPLEQQEPPRLTRDQLFPSPSRLAEIAAGQQDPRDRNRQRDDVEPGEEIWLNLQHDRLVSFFRRFHDRVERVWNYPAEAAMNGIDGTLELLIIVNKEGELIDVDLRRTSGSDLLDFEAIQAVYRAAPFGPLGRHYPHDQLRIRAYFEYRLSGRYIYGR